jgi:arabinogalactan endo-1,4-beta-galactosidase
VRLFVQPGNANQENKDEGVCQDLPFVIKLSKRIKKAGYKLMLDFHYSDTWADPAKQFTPKSWLNTNTRTLNDTIYNYTTRCLRAMKAEGVTPDMIQVGNEISFGMLWPTGKIDPQTPNNWDIFTDYLKSGIRACRKECPDAKIIIHTERAGEWELTKSFYLHLKQYNVDYDIIGLSYYPMWHKTIPILSNTLDSIESMFPEKKVMIVETAFYYSHDKDIWAKSKNEYSEFYPINAEGQRTFTSQLVKELNRHNNVTGLFWWFPEENGYKNNVIKSWINRGLFNNKNGKALPALYETKNFIK